MAKKKKTKPIDVGNAIWLLTIVLLLLRQAHSGMGASRRPAE